MDRFWTFLARRIAPHLDRSAPPAARTVILDREAGDYSAADIEAFCAAWNRFSR
jgi:hypothetical protein